MTTFDYQAMRIMLSNDRTEERERRLLALRRAADTYHGNSCPECSGRDVQDNGASRMSERSYLCSECGHLWDAEAP